MLFVPTSRAALNATPLASHGRTSAVLSVGRLLGAGLGAGLGGVVLAGGTDASTVHGAMLLACILCVAVGIPASTRLGTPSGGIRAPSTPGRRSAAAGSRCTVFPGPVRGSHLGMVSGRPQHRSTCA